MTKCFRGATAKPPHTELTLQFEDMIYPRMKHAAVLDDLNPVDAIY